MIKARQSLNCRAFVMQKNSEVFRIGKKYSIIKQFFLAWLRDL